MTLRMTNSCSLSLNRLRALLVLVLSLAALAGPGFTQETTDSDSSAREATASIRLRTTPADVTILIDGVEQAPRSGVVSATSAAASQCVPVCWIDGLATGRFDLEVKRAGFRTYGATLVLPDLRDYELPRIELEPQEAVIGFRGLPADAVVTANGKTLAVDRRTTPPEVTIVPGEYELTVVHGASGSFESSVSLRDRSRLTVDVGLRPLLAVLGILGSDPLAEQALRSIADHLAGQTSYSIVFEPTGEALLADLGVNDGTLSGNAEAARRELDWISIRAQLESEAPAALYLLAVLDEDREADRINLWWLSAAPGPATPDVLALRVPGGRPDDDDMARLTAALKPEPERRVPWVGVTLVESEVNNPLVVADVALASPAYRAGIEPAMELASLNGSQLKGAQDWIDATSALRPGEVLEVRIAGARGEPAVHTIEPEWGWSMLDPFAPELLPATAAAHLIQKLKSPGDVPAWLLELELASILFAQGEAESAVRLLRRIEAPGRGGLGGETVEYMIGLALSELADQVDAEYGNQAVALFRDLEAAENSRLGSDRGPSIAARSRLHAKTSLALVPPDTEIVVGEYRAEVRVSGSDIVAVRFLVDGRHQATEPRSKAWTMLRLAKYPTQQVLTVEGLDADGHVVAANELVLNQQRGDLRVNIEEPARGVDVVGTTPARAAIVVPKGREVSAVEFRVGDEVQVELQRPPWRAEISVPRARNEAEPVYLTVTATLDDGSGAEDVRFLSASALSDSIDVDMVELYTAVTDRGNRPIVGLREADFTVLEDGVTQQISTFELVENLPLTLGVAIDTSASMDPVMEETRKAAAQFLTNLLNPSDSSFAVAFASRPHLLMGQTSDVEAVVDTVRALRASGQTALHDALMTGLYYFRGIRGRRALVLLSDGEDTSSSATYPDVLEYAKHSEVVIYTIGLGIGDNEPLLRSKLQEIAAVTGGRAFFISAARELQPVYRQIDRELRSQYLLAYNSNQQSANDDFRQVEVRVTDGRRARTISGYYP
ncbi:MAG: VWA domain-containing protein [Acidobacteria bacterium]|nr:VWA domain-containing protein [Acidobacteriota bacterium]